MATSSFAVHSFHININIGDSAIHLLVDTSTVPKPTVHRAVYIDGGKSGDPTFNKTSGIIQEIEAVYNPDPNGHFDYTGPPALNQWLRFDSIILTHFDDDHFGGLIFLINEGFRAAAAAAVQALVDQTQNAITDATDPWPANTGRIVQTRWLKAHDAVAIALRDSHFVQNRYMKYTTVMPGFNPLPDDTQGLLTTVYVPYMSTDVRANPKVAFVTSEAYDPNKCWTNDANVLTWDFAINVPQINNYPDGVPRTGLFKSGAKRNFYFDYICKFVGNDEKYLGVDVLTGTPLGNGAWANIQNPGQLVKEHNLAVADGPRIYIVGGSQTVLGNKQLLVTAANAAGGKEDPFFPPAMTPLTPILPPSAPSTGPPSTQLFAHAPAHAPAFAEAGQHFSSSLPVRPNPESHPAVAVGSSRPKPAISHRAGHFQVLVVDDLGKDDAILQARTWSPNKRNNNSFARNACSICCMVLARTEHDPDTQAFKALHYFGGDALWDTEAAIALWASQDGTPLQLEVMKMSHHGAMEALPVRMLDTFQPKRIVGSIGTGTGVDQSYGHPRSELMLYLAPWLRKWMTIDPTRPDSAIFTTNYPGYFNVHGRPKLNIRINLNAWILNSKGEEGSPFSVWRAFLWNLCEQAQITNDTENVLAGWPRERFDPSDDDYDANVSQQILASKISDLYDTWEGSKPGVNRVPGTAYDTTLIPRCIEFRLTSDPTGIVANTWRGAAPNGRIPFPTTRPIVPARRRPIRLIRSRSVPVFLPGAHSAPLTNRPAPLKRAYDSTFGVEGYPVSKSRAVERQDTTALVIQQNTDSTGVGGVLDDNPEANSLGNITDPNMDTEPTSLFRAAPMGLPPQNRLHATAFATLRDPFITGHATAMAALAPAPSAAASGSPDLYYRFYGNMFQNQTSQFGPHDVLLSGTGNTKLSDFVSCLTLGYLTCSPPPPPPSPPPVASPQYQLYKDDEWMHRLGASDLGLTSFSISGIVVPPSSQQNFSTVQVQSLEALLDIGNTAVTFSSSAATSVCGLPATTGSYADALLDTHTILTLGIQPGPAEIPVSLADLAPTDSALIAWADLFSIAGLNLKVDTSPMSRTAISFQPGSANLSWRRIQMVPRDPTWSLTDKLPFLSSLGISFSNYRFVMLSQVKVLRDALSATVVETHELMIRTTITITQPASFQADLWWAFGENSCSLIVCFTANQDLGSLVDWIISLLNTNSGSNFSRSDIHPDNLFSDMPNTKEPGATGPKAYVQQIQLTLNTPQGGSPSIADFKMILEIDLFGAAFIVQIGGPPVTLSARLWTFGPDTTITPTPGPGIAGPYVPFLEDYQTLHPFGDVSGDINLTQLVGPDNGSNPPLGIQVDITELYLTLQRLSGSTIASFGGTILCNKPSDDDGFPHLDIAIFTICGNYQTAGPTTQKFYDLKLATQIMIFDLRDPKPAVLIPPAAVNVSAEVSNGTWTFTASAMDLQFAALYQLFDKNANSSIVDVLSHIYVPQFEVTYVYSPSAPSSIDLQGALIIGSLELELHYTYTAADKQSNTPKTWSIEAFLGVVGQNTHTIGSVISGLDPDVGGFLEQVPFVRDCALPVTPPLDEFADSGFPDAPVQLFISSDGNYTVMCFRIEISTPLGSLSCTCVRFQPAVLGDAKSRPKPKLIVRVALDKLPSIPKIPVVGSLPQPVDDIDYLFVRDANASTATPSGITDTELAAVNAILIKGHFTEIPARQVQSDFKSSGPPASGSTTGSSSSTPNLILLAGHHFMVRAEGKVIVDHLFGGGSGPAPPVPQHQASTTTTITTPATRSGGLADQQTATTSGAMKKTYDILTVNNFGLQLKNGYLYMVLDLTINMGPVQLTIIGFGVGVLLQALNLNQLAHLSIDDFSIILSGMSVYCNAPPVLIGGVFIHQEDDQAELYEGGLTVSIPPYTLLAVGAYRRAKPDGFKSIFVFARFDGPLLSLEFAEISGVEVGFGYNYDLTMPKVENVLDYPLLHSQVGTNNPMDILTQFGTWNQPVPKHFWFAVGCKIDSFELISMDTAIMIAFSTDGDFKIGLAGLATASMPPMVQKREEAFLYVELGVVGAIDIGAGATWIEAQLTPNSFILYPDCHLTGGFALCYWFKPSPYEGDWVFTVGGYHPAFKPPSYYPQVDRVGISWNLSDCLTVQGGAFFAITPNAAMAGGNLKATFSVSFVEAHFEAWAMLLIKFKPFFFIADIGVSVGCGVHFSIGIIHIGFDIDLSATVHLSGPRFGGTVYVDLKVHTFSIDFGDQDNTPAPLDWPAFLNTVRQSGPKAAANNETTDLIIALAAGSATETIKSTQSQAATTDTSSQPSVWSVRAATFVFRVESKVPVDHATIDDGTAEGRKATASSNANPSYARLMGRNVNGALNSALTITVTPATAAADADSNAYQLVPMLKTLPLALWGSYTEKEDPIRSGNNIDTLLNPSDNATAVEHCVGYIVQAPKPALPPPEHILPEFNAANAMEEAIFPDGGTPPRKDYRPLIYPPVMDDRRPRIIRADGANNAEFTPLARPSGLSGADLWSSVKTTWTAASATDAQTIAEVWTDLMGWADPKNQVAPVAVQPAKPSGSGVTPAPAPAPVYPVPPFTALTGAAPAEVLDQFDDYFLGLPQVMTGVA